MNGAIRPPRLEPPPAQPMTMSGMIASIHPCALFAFQADDGLVQQHLVEDRCRAHSGSRACEVATSTASEMAQPSEPVVSGFFGQNGAANLGGVRRGEGVTLAP